MCKSTDKFDCVALQVCLEHVAEVLACELAGKLEKGMALARIHRSHMQFDSTQVVCKLQ